jgi:NarL family two-component system response regulator LiaR
MSNADRIRILIADDHAVVREGLRSVIDVEPDMEVVGEAADGVSVVQQAEKLNPDIVLLDMIMPRQDGLSAIEQMNQENIPARIIVLTSFGDEQKIFPAIKAGAQGYLLKDTLPEQILQAIRDVHQGKSSLHPAIAHKVMAELIRPANETTSPDPLTPREIDVLKLIAQGLSNQEIASQLSLSEGTVGKHVNHILRKLHLANRTQAALYALREELVPLNPEPNLGES